MNETIKKLQRTKLVPAVLSIAFGIALIIARKGAADVAVKIGAVMLMLCGVGCLLMFLFGPVKKEGTQLVVGGILALIGLLIWFNSSALVDLFPIFTGIGLVLNGLSNLAPLSQPEENAGNGLIILFSVLMIAGGVMILIQPAAIRDALLIYVGICYILNGVMDLILLHRVREVLLRQ